MCPLTCEVVKEAIRLHEERGIIMGKYIDEMKSGDGYCHLCTRNEKAITPIKDMGKE